MMNVVLLSLPAELIFPQDPSTPECMNLALLTGIFTGLNLQNNPSLPAGMC